MTFQTVGSIFHNSVLPSKFYRLNSDFLGFRITLISFCIKIPLKCAGVYDKKAFLKIR